MKAKQRRMADFETRSVMLFSVALVSMVLAGAAKAQVPETQAPTTTANAAALPNDTQAKEFRQKDAQATMRLSSAQVQQAFQHIDTNRDGRLSRAEVTIFPRVERHFERIDVNRDDSISPAEFEEALQQAS